MHNLCKRNICMHCVNFAYTVYKYTYTIQQRTKKNPPATFTPTWLINYIIHIFYLNDSASLAEKKNLWNIRLFLINHKFKNIKKASEFFFNEWAHTYNTLENVLHIKWLEINYAHASCTIYLCTTYPTRMCNVFLYRIYSVCHIFNLILPTF